MTKFRIEDMTCGHRVKTLTRAIQAIDPTAQVSAQLGEKMLIVNGSLAAEDARHAIQEADYSAQPIDRLS